MPSSPKLRSSVNVIPQGDRLQLRVGDETIVVLEGAPRAFLEEALTLMDGTREVEALIEALGAEKEATLRELIAELDREGLLEGEATTARPRSPGLVAVVGEQRLTEAILAALAEEGCLRASASTVASLEAATELLVCAVERPDLSLLEAGNAWAVGNGRAALFVDLSHGHHATVGPFYVPGDGACYRCFRARLLENTAAPEEQLAYEAAQRGAARPLRGPAVPPALRRLVAALVALEAAAYFSEHQPVQTLGGAITVDLSGLRLWREPCFRVPWCEACGG